ncbi:hypothetical protein C8R44DRAFT_727210 [Mycena epipterygia]|nr:hypothetical protein C8R44DRAFT_727210 [Mycena epipterygia]
MAPQLVGPALPVGIPLAGAAKQIEVETVAAIDPDDDLYVAPSDDTAVPLQQVIRESLSLDIPAAFLPGNKVFCVAADTMVVGDTGSLQGGSDSENIWGYSDNATDRLLCVTLWKLGNIFDARYALPLLPYTPVQ